MKTRRIVLALLVAAAPQAIAHDFPPFRATLTGYQEVPAVSTVAGGTFQATLIGDFLDPNARVDYVLTYSGLQADITQAHIHFAQKSVNGAIVVWLCGTGTGNLAGPAGTPACPGARSGTVRGSFGPANVQNVPTQQISTGDLAEVILAMRSANAYANVHTTVSPGGEIRGQIGPGNSQRP